ncbi:MAG: AAA family ATPase [Kiloniellales bacterium]|nr:AAA family ATPase [Kiloniellales bacterium]
MNDLASGDHDSDIARWLISLGLERYVPLFAQHEIDLEVLPELSEKDLEELGIALGPRKKLLKAIQELATSEPKSSPSETRAADDAERRQLTIMFCDLVKSTDLAERLDPEDFKEVIQTYHQSCREVLRQFGGFVARYSGDGILAYFGFPQARENDAERALRAGLAIIETVPNLDTGLDVTLQVRVGTATGLVVAGHTIEGDAGSERLAVGEAPNLAARLQSLAKPNTMLIGPDTHKLVGGTFEFADAGRHKLKGISEPVQVWRVMGVKSIDSRFDAMHEADLTPMIGREREIELLLDRWATAKGGDGQVVLLSGEAGIGKSRITQVLYERVESEPHTILRYQCSSYYNKTSLYPLIEQITRSAGIGDDDPDPTKLSKLERLLESAGVDRALAVPLIGPLLFIPTDESYVLPEMTPDRYKETTLSVIADLMLSHIGEKPLLLVFEDIHWIDPVSMELVELLINRIQGTRALLMITSRQHPVERWDIYPHITSLTLNRLTQGQVGKFVAQVTGGKSLPEDVLSHILAKTDGIPLFIEELTKTILESGLLRETDQGFTLTGPLPPYVIPGTLHDSLMERLDHLGPAKRVAQVGSCIGRDFEPALLAAVSDFDDMALQSGLDQLVASKLLFRHGAPPDESYSFKHALVQQAAHESLLRTRRQALHGRIAELLLQGRDESPRARPELIARHFQEAGRPDEAVRYYIIAGQRAAEISAFAESVGRLDEALGLLMTRPAGPARLETELRLQLARGKAFRSWKGTGAEETQGAYLRARALCEEIGEQRVTAEFYSDYVHTLYGQSASAFDAAKLTVASEAAERLVALGESRADMPTEIIGHQAAGMCSFSRGDLTTARHHLEQAVAHSDTQVENADIKGAQFPSLALTYLSWTLFALGQASEAQRRCAQALRHAEQGSAYTRALTLCNACYLFQFLRDTAAVRRHAEQLLTIAGEHDMYAWQDMGSYFRGWVLVQEGVTAEGIEAMEDVVRRCDVGAIEMPYVYALLAEALGKGGNFSGASELLQVAVEAVGSTGERWYEPEIHRIRGELTLLQPTSTARDQAEACFWQALEVSREIQARMWELRAALSLARLWTSQDKHSEARELVTPQIQGFRGQPLPELSEAESLLQCG